MWENLIIGLVIIAAAVYLGRRAWKQWRAALTPGKGISCGCSCSGCDTLCDERQATQPRR